MAGHDEVHFDCCVKRAGARVLSSTDSETASAMVRRAEDLKAKREGRKVRDVRTGIARRIGVGTGTVRNIRKQRRKNIPSWLMAAIRRVLIEVLQSEVRALEHEIAIHRQIGDDHRNPDLAKAEASLQAAKKILTGV